MADICACSKDHPLLLPLNETVSPILNGEPFTPSGNLISVVLPFVTIVTLCESIGPKDMNDSPVTK